MIGETGVVYRAVPDVLGENRSPRLVFVIEAALGTGDLRCPAVRLADGGFLPRAPEEGHAQESEKHGGDSDAKKRRRLPERLGAVRTAARDRISGHHGSQLRSGPSG